jgi:hypothetical protein
MVLIPYSLFPIPYSLVPSPRPLVPTPPLPPGGINFPFNLADYFLNSMESTPVENFLPRNIPHREIWPLKITGNVRFLPIKRHQSIAPAPFR